MRELFKEIIKNDVKPYLAARGYSKKNLRFYRADQKLFYTFYFQNSAGNTPNHVMFYINCSIHSFELEPFQSLVAVADPLKAVPHFTSRIEEIVPSAPDRYSLTPETDLDKFRAELLSHLQEALAFFDTMTSARAILDYYMDRTALHLSEETFRFLLHAGEQGTARDYLAKLQAKYGAEKRWAIFERKYGAIWAEYGAEE